MEFSVGALVVYGIHGVCRICGLEKQRSGGAYYVLEPVQQEGSRYLIPTHSPAALAKLRPLITRGALEELLASDSVLPEPWIEEENRRKQLYRELITSGDRAALIRMFCALEVHRRRQIASGRKVHICDENFHSDVKKLLCDEFSLVLQQPREQIVQYILRAVLER